jgi:cation diffusion facilitator family transporter
MQTNNNLGRYAWLSIGTAVITITLKLTAYALTGSIGLLSDGVESGVNLVTAVFSLIMLTIAAQPPDDEHQHGHGKAEYFSSGLEGLLIVIAAGGIAVTAVQHIFNPQPLEQLGVGLLISLAAALCNLITALILQRAGQQHDSITLKASSQHLMSDVYTSLGVVVGIGAIALSGWQWLDSIIALIVAAHILRAGCCSFIILPRDSWICPCPKMSTSKLWIF